MAVPELLPQYYDLLSPDYDYKIAIDPRGTGKSFNFLLASIIIARSMHARILCCREYMTSIAESSKAEIELLIDESGYGKEFRITKTSIEHRGTGSIYMFRGLARNATNLKSIPKIDIAIVEECENVTEDSLVRILMPTLRQNGAELWMMGNRRFRTDIAYSLFCTGNEPERTRLFDSTYHDNLHISQKFVNDAEHMRKTKPALYRHVYLGEMLNEAGIKMVHHINMDNGNHVFKPNDMVVIGVDIARSGGDKTAIYVRRGRYIVHREGHYEMDSDKLGPILQGLVLKYKPMFVNIDATGHGAWVGDSLKAYDVKVRPIVFSSKAKAESKYSNKRTELYSYVDDFCLNGGMVPSEKGLIEDLESSYYLYDRNERSKMISKDDIRKQIGHSTDDGDAFCLTLETHGQDMFEVKSDAKRDNQALINNLITQGSF